MEEEEEQEEGQEQEEEANNNYDKIILSGQKTSVVRYGPRKINPFLFPYKVCEVPRC